MRESRVRIAAAIITGFAVIGCARAETAPEPTGLEWSRVFEGEGTARVAKVALDSEEDAVVVGSFTGTLEMDGTTLTSNGGFDTFLAKLAPDGHVLWARSFGSADHDHGSSVAVDHEGNIWMAGDAGSGVDFGRGTLESTAPSPLFLAKFGKDGAPLWNRLFGDGGYNGASDVLVDDDDDVYLTGSFAASVDFGVGAMTTAGSSDAFLAKFDSEATCLASRAFGDADIQSGISLSRGPRNDIVLLGNLGGEVDLGGGPLLGPPGGGGAFFVAKFDENLNHIWSAAALSSGLATQQSASHEHSPVSCHSVAAQSDGGTVLTGVTGTAFAMGSKDFEAPVFSTAVLQQFGKYGDVLLDGPIGTGNGQDEGAVAVDAEGRTLLAGSFLGDLDFGSDAPIVSEGGRDLFLARFDAGGAFSSSERFGDSSHSEIGWTVASGGSRTVVGGWVRLNDTFGADRPLVLKFY